MKRYGAYMSSESVCFGRVPSHWSLDRLGRHFTERRETVSDVDFPPLSVTKDGVVPQLENVAKTDNGDNRKRVAVGDFVINSRSDRKGSAGLSALDGSVSVISTVVTPLDMHPRFVHHLLRSGPFQEEYYRFGTGIVADLWSTRYSAMKNIKLPVPPLAEQVAIADFLDRETDEIDAFIADQEELVEVLQERRKALISVAVTRGIDHVAALSHSGTPWWGVVPEHWRLDKLGRYFHVVLGKMLDGSKEQRPGDLTRPYVRAANIQDSGLDLEDVNEMFFSPSEALRLSIQKGDLLVVEGGSIGTSFLVDEDMPGWSFQKTVNRVRARGDASTSYLQYVLRHLRDGGVLAMMCAGSTIAHLTADKLQRLVMPLPPAAEQSQIVVYLDHETAEIDAAIADAKEAVEVSKERRAALISAAVTGKIDVRNHVAAMGV